MLRRPPIPEKIAPFHRQQDEAVGIDVIRDYVIADRDKSRSMVSYREQNLMMVSQTSTAKLG